MAVDPKYELIGTDLYGSDSFYASVMCDVGGRLIRSHPVNRLLNTQKLGIALHFGIGTVAHRTEYQKSFRIPVHTGFCNFHGRPWTSVNIEDVQGRANSSCVLGDLYWMCYFLLVASVNVDCAFASTEIIQANEYRIYSLSIHCPSLYGRVQSIIGCPWKYDWPH
ncbi:hypothetical protein J6590_076037 [Homalodisca vitripennis]|nr:hypothetical protein J6590_076037 [Homalodisca vitripennis]